MAICYSYQRCSSLAQVGGDSFLRQNTDLKKWLDRHPEHTLDEKLRIDASSGYHGKNLEEGGALGDFLGEIENGKIKAGSILIVESIDRLTRMQVDPAYQLVRSILLKGIAIVTLSPERELTTDSLNNPFQIMEIVSIAYRAWEESQIKSERLKAKWVRKRENAVKDKKPFGKACPAWLTVVDGRFEIVEWKGEIVQQIFQLVIDGRGIAQIASDFNKNKVPLISTKKNSKGWRKSYILKIIKSRAVLGEYEPCRTQIVKGRKKPKRVPTGELLVDFYPRIISTEIFNAAKIVMAKRKKNNTRLRSNEVRNLFGGLFVDKDGNKMEVRNKGKGDIRIENSFKTNGKYQSVSYRLVEATILLMLPEVQPQPSISVNNDLPVRLAALQGELAFTISRLNEIKQKVSSSTDNLDILMAGAATLKKQKAELTKQIEEIESQIATEQSNPIEQIQHLCGQLLDNSPIIRSQLRQLLPQVVEQIIIAPYKKDNRTEAEIEIKYREFPSFHQKVSTERFKDYNSQRNYWKEQNAN